MVDALGQEMEGGDLILHIDTRHDTTTLGVYNGKATKRGRPYFFHYYGYGEEKVRKICSSTYFKVIKITEEQFRAKAGLSEAEALLGLRE